MFLQTLALPETLSTLSDGDVLTAAGGLDLRLAATAPVAFDIHWLRSQPGSLRGFTGIRIDAGAAATVSLAASAHCLATVRRQDRLSGPWLRVTMEAARATPGLAVEAALAPPLHHDPLQLALAGEHPSQLLRQLLKCADNAPFARKSGVAAGDLFTLASLWPALTTTTEPVVWRAAANPARLAAIAAATEWLANERPTAAALQQHSANPLLAGWFQALTGVPSFAAIPGSAIRHAVRTAQAILPLVQLPGLARLLGQLLRAWTPGPATMPCGARDLAHRLYGAAGAALARTIAAEFHLHRAGPERPLLIDASLPMDDAGLALCRQALGGTLTPLFAARSAEIHDAILAPCLSRPRTLEIHIPYHSTASREKELASMAGLEIVPAAGGGLALVRPSARPAAAGEPAGPHANTERICRLIIGSTLAARDREPAADNFTLSFSDVRNLLPGGGHDNYFQMLAGYGIHDVTPPVRAARATLNITLPGAAVDAWPTLPLARIDLLSPLLCPASLALQETLRRWLPALYLDGPARYAAPATALPLLVYQYSQPFARVGLHQYTYDSMDPASILSAANSAAPRLQAPLARIQAMLLARGEPKLAAHYDPASLARILASVVYQRRHFAALLAAESFLVEQVLSLARHGRNLAATAEAKPDLATRELHNTANAFLAVFRRRLTRLYAGQDYSALGPLFLLEATAALAGRTDSIEATFTLEPLDQRPQPAGSQGHTSDVETPPSTEITWPVM